MVLGGVPNMFDIRRHDLCLLGQTPIVILIHHGGTNSLPSFRQVTLGVAATGELCKKMNEAIRSLVVRWWKKVTAPWLMDSVSLRRHR